MNILMIKTNKYDGVEYNLKAFWLMSLKGKVQVNLDGYFPARDNPEDDYKDLGKTKGSDKNHLVIITDKQSHHRIKFGYLKMMDVVMDLNKVICVTPRGPAGMPIECFCGNCSAFRRIHDGMVEKCSVCGDEEYESWEIPKVP